MAAAAVASSTAVTPATTPAVLPVGSETSSDDSSSILNDLGDFCWPFVEKSVESPEENQDDILGGGNSADNSSDPADLWPLDGQVGKPIQKLV